MQRLTSTIMPDVSDGKSKSKDHPKALMYKSYSSGTRSTIENEKKLPPALPVNRWYVLLMVVSLIMTIMAYFFRQWELDIIVTMQASMNEASLVIFQIFSESKSLVSLGLSSMALVYGYFFRNGRLKRGAVFILLCVGISGLFSYGIKNTVKEPRPYEMDSRIIQYSGGGGYGFPSGHVIEATAAAAATTIVFSNTIATIFAFTWVLIIMLSRMFLGVHDCDQVLGGLFPGLCCPLTLIKTASVLPKKYSLLILPELP